MNPRLLMKGFQKEVLTHKKANKYSRNVLKENKNIIYSSIEEIYLNIGVARYTAFVENR